MRSKYLCFFLIFSTLALVLFPSHHCWANQKITPWLSLLLSPQKNLQKPIVILDTADDSNKIELISGSLFTSGSARVSYTDHTVTEFSFNLLSGPNGLSMDPETGAVSFAAPTVTTRQTNGLIFEVSTEDESWNYQGSVIVNPVAAESSFIATSQDETFLTTTGTVEVQAGTGEIPSGTELVIKESYNSDGDQQFSLSFDPDLPENSNITLNFNDISPDQSKDFPVKDLRNNYCDSIAPYLVGDTNFALFYRSVYRVPDSIDIPGKILKLYLGFVRMNASGLCSTLDPENAFIDFKEYIPVVFLHGFTPLVKGGGEGTWKQMFALLKDEVIEGKKILPLEFRWRTNAKFEEVAVDFGKAIQEASQLTGGKDVHIVAHSFGGLLARTYLQGLSKEPVGSMPAASLLTVGTPHSGIFDTNTASHPDGTDGVGGNVGIDWCAQQSCFQAGDSILSLPIIGIFGWLVNLAEGSIIREINNSANKFPFPNFPIKVLVGMRTTNQQCENLDDYFKKGDGLISFWGQRFIPTDKYNDKNLRRGEILTSLGAKVTEQLIGDADWDIPISDRIANGFEGYGHTYRHRQTDPCIRSILTGDNTPNIRAYFSEVGVESKTHATFVAIRDWLAEQHQSSSIVSDGLIRHYQLDGSAADSSGNGYHGTEYNNYEYIDGPDHGIKLIGSGHTGMSGGHVLIPFIALNEYPAFTISLWVNHETSTTWGGNSFIRFGGTIDSSGTGDIVSISYGSNFPSTLGFSIGGKYTRGGVSMPYSESDLNKWHHLVLRADNGTLTGFVDGSSIGTDTYELGPMATRKAGLGVSWFNSGGTSSTRFIGIIDDVRIYDRALTAVEINQLFHIR